MKKKPLTKDERADLVRLKALAETDIDTADIPEAPAANWMHARRGEFYRPVKQPVTIRLDADVVSWFKEHAADGGYQTEINRVLRRHVTGAAKRRS